MRAYLLLLAVCSIIIFSSCMKEEPMMEEEMEEEIDPFFKTNFNWGQAFLDELDISNPADSLPLSIDITWENPLAFDIEDEELPGEGAAIGKESADDDAYILVSVDIEGTDTTTLFFEIYGDLEVKSYDFAGLDLFAEIFGGSEEIPDGTIIPYLISTKSQAASLPLILTIFGGIDFSGSTFEITSIDTENNEIDGRFTINYVTPESDDQASQTVLTVEDGEFSGVPIVE